MNILSVGQATKSKRASLLLDVFILICVKEGIESNRNGILTRYGFLECTSSKSIRSTLHCVRSNPLMIAHACLECPSDAVGALFALFLKFHIRYNLYLL